MDRGRAARGGQKPTAPTTRLIKGYSSINAYYATRHGTLQHPRRMTFRARPEAAWRVGERSYAPPIEIQIRAFTTTNAPHRTSTHPMARSERTHAARRHLSPITAAPRPKAIARIPRFPDK